MLLSKISLDLRVADLGPRSHLNGIINHYAGFELLARGDGSFAIFCEYLVSWSHLILFRKCSIVCHLEQTFAPVRLPLTTYLNALFNFLFYILLTTRYMLDICRLSQLPVSSL